MSAIQADIAADAAAQETVRVRIVRVWDLPVRIFHWSLVVAIAAANVTGEFGGGDWAHWHGRIGWLYGVGTDQGTGWRPTQLKSEFFQQPEEAKRLAVAFNTAAKELARVAPSGDLAAIKTQFGKLSETCKSCHNSFRQRD